MPILEPQCLQVDGRARRYLISRPASQKPAPLVLALHGGGADADFFARTTNDLAGQAAARGYLVAFAEGTGPTWPNGRLAGHWNSGPHCRPEEEIDDVTYLMSMIEDIDRSHPVEPTRIYACGHSNGGTMCYRLACERAETIAAIAVTGCSLDVEGPMPSHGVSVLHVHGTLDRFHPFSGGIGIVPTFPGPFLGAERATEKFVEWNRCNPVGDHTGTQGCVTFLRWADGRDGSEVVLGRMEDMGHQWPPWYRETTPEQAKAMGFPVGAYQGPFTTDIDMSALALDFFDQHSR